jgi:NitT/TauT family transport system substrate-binding protein
MMARGQGIPLTAFATVGQQHPFAFFSLPAKPVRTPRDMIGKRIGVQTTAQFLLSALLKKNGIEENQITKVVLGSDLSPLATGQVDAITGWETSVRALKVLGPDYVTMRLWDQGIRLYANIYYAPGERLAAEPQTFAAFLRAAGKGWAFARENPGKAVALLVEEMPNLTAEQEMIAAGVMLKYVFTEQTRDHGWGQLRSSAVGRADRPLRLVRAIPQGSAQARRGDDHEDPRPDRRGAAQARLTPP